MFNSYLLEIDPLPPGSCCKMIIRRKLLFSVTSTPLGSWEGQLVAAEAAVA